MVCLYKTTINELNLIMELCNHLHKILYQDLPNVPMMSVQYVINIEKEKKG